MRRIKFIIMSIALLFAMTAGAQTITSVHGTLSDDMGPLMGATVCEIDGVLKYETMRKWTDIVEEALTK